MQSFGFEQRNAAQEKTELSSQVEEELMQPGATDPSQPLDPEEQQQEIPPGKIASGEPCLSCCAEGCNAHRTFDLASLCVDICGTRAVEQPELQEMPAVLLLCEVPTATCPAEPHHAAADSSCLCMQLQPNSQARSLGGRPGPAAKSWTSASSCR